MEITYYLMLNRMSFNNAIYNMKNIYLMLQKLFIRLPQSGNKYEFQSFKIHSHIFNYSDYLIQEPQLPFEKSK